MPICRPPFLNTKHGSWIWCAIYAVTFGKLRFAGTSTLKMIRSLAFPILTWSPSLGLLSNDSWWTGNHVIMMRILFFIHKIYIYIYYMIYIYIHTLYQDVPSPVLASFWPFKKPTFGTSLTFPVHTFSIQAALKPSAACAPRSFSTSAPTRTNVPWQKGSVQKYIFAKVMDHLFLTTFFQRNSGFSLLLCCLIVIPSPKLT